MAYFSLILLFLATHNRMASVEKSSALLAPQSKA